MAEFFNMNRTVKRVEMLTIYDCNKGISGVLEAIACNRGIREFKMPINAIGTEEALYILKLL